MTREEIVLKRLEKRAKSPLHFRGPIWDDYQWRYNSMEMYQKDKDEFEDKINKLKRLKTINDRVSQILLLSSSYRTDDKNNNYQCSAGAKRSVQDIWRIYMYYFGEIDIFSIMRELYKLTVKESRFSTWRCCTVQKQVFWNDGCGIGKGNRMAEEYNRKADLGVAVKDWENIGLNQE